MPISNIKYQISGTKYLLSAFLVVLGILLFTVTTDREFINLAPDEGQQNSIALEKGVTYEQSFSATRTSISRVGLFIRPNTTAIPDKAFKVELLRNDNLAGEGTVPALFIDNERPVQVRFKPSIQVNKGDKITLRLVTPPELSGLFRAQLRQLDESFDPAYATFTINDQKQPAPLAYQVYYGYKPPLAIQFAGLTLIGALCLLSYRWMKKYQTTAIIILAVLLAALYVAPAFLLTTTYSLLTIVVFVAFLSMFFFLRYANLSLPATLVGSALFAFTTWWPLHLIAGRGKLAAFVALPLLAWGLLALKQRRPASKKVLLAALAISLAILLFAPWSRPADIGTTTANVRDIFLDPNQVPSSVKFESDYIALQIPIRDPDAIQKAGGWDHFGAYVGLIGLGLAIIGLATYFPLRVIPLIRGSQRGLGTKRVHNQNYTYYLLLATGILGLLASTQPFIVSLLAAILPFPSQYLIILTVFALATFAAHGLEALKNFLLFPPASPSEALGRSWDKGGQGGSNKLITAIVYTIAILVLLDLFHVTARTLEFGLI